MTDTPSSPTDPADDDLLASLYLDGEATAEERARVESDPSLMARVEAFKAIAADLSEVTPPPDLARLQISAALDLFDQQQRPTALSSAAQTTASEAPSSVTSLADRRERKQSKGIPSWLGVAAAAALVVGGIGFASTLGGDSDDSSADVAMEASDEVAESGANRTVDDDAMEEESDSAEAASTEMMQDEPAAEEMEVEDFAADDTSSDVAGNDATDDAMEEESDDEATTAAPIPLDQFEATTAAEYFELLGDQPLQPIENAPCAGSPLVEGLFGVDSFIPVVLDGVVSSLLVQEGVPATSVIVGPTCEIVLE